MSGNRFAAKNEQYATQQAETAEATVVSFYDLAQKGVQAAVNSQKFMLDVAVRQSINLVELHKTVLDAVVRQSSAFVAAAQQHFEHSTTVFANLTQRWSEDVQNTFAGVARRATQETPIPRPSKETDTEALEVSRGNRDEPADGIEQTSKSLAVLSESIQQSAERTAEARKTILDLAEKQNETVTEAVPKNGTPDTPVTSEEVLDETAKVPIVDQPTPAVPVVVADVDQESIAAPPVAAADVDQESTPTMAVVEADVDQESTPVVAAEAPSGGSGSSAADSPARSTTRRTRAVRKPEHPPAAGKHSQMHLKKP
jgi:hypothetical protein